jgi:D-glycero-D-manno-heptose 1,7-bisphosphate phosphatase
MSGGERRGAVIFDRDGVLNEDVEYAFRPEQIRWVEGAMDAVRAVNELGLFAFVATNQSGVARGYYTEADVRALHDWMAGEFARHGARIDAFVYSPYHPEGSVEAYRQETECRKPKPGMLRDLLARFPVDPARAVMIGDKPSDVEAAQAAGIEGILFEGGSVLERLRPALDRIARR